MKPQICILTITLAVLFFLLYATREPYLNFHGHFKPKKHFFFERCSKCGKKLKHYHWFWGKGDFMACDVDYRGNTTWFCENCNDELSQNVLNTVPQNNERSREDTNNGK